GDEIFSSSDENGFEQLLKKEKFLEKQNLTADQLAILFRLLKARYRDRELVTAEELASGDLENYRDHVSKPLLTKKDNCFEFAFWTYALRSQAIEKWNVQISEDYQVEYSCEELTKAST
ncbi:hypothetical protein L0222_21735, partial [bacterium]|nr:hypothetical protein [bacterium]